MKLGKVTSNDPIERQALGFHKSTVQQLQHYRSYYQAVHGDDITMSLLVEEICKRFMREDRGFHKFEEQNPDPAKSSENSAPTAGRTGTKS